MTVGLDTSVVVRLLTGEPVPAAEAAMRFLHSLWGQGSSALVSEWVAAEAYHALQHHYGVSKRGALDSLRALLGTRGVEASEELETILGHRRLESAKPGFVDRIIHADYERSGVDSMVTFESAARKLPRVHVLSG